jgi:hypothetical protein
VQLAVALDEAKARVEPPAMGDDPVHQVAQGRADDGIAGVDGGAGNASHHVVLSRDNVARRRLAAGTGSRRALRRRGVAVVTVIPLLSADQSAGYLAR